MAVDGIAISRTNYARGGLVAVAILAGLLGFSSTLAELVRRWTTQEEYSHGFLIPIVVAWLLWTRFDALRASLGRPAWSGLVIMLLAAAMQVVGEVSATFILSQLAFVTAILGLTLGLGGYSLLRTAFVPIIFLLFAIPMPYFIDSMMSLRLELISSQLGVFFISLFAIPVYLDGNIIDLGNYKVQVVEACSGLRYLYPLMSLSFLAAYLFQAPIWQRAVVFVSSIPITIVMNSIRIGIVGITVDYWGTQAADGFLHFFEGWIIFLACAGILGLEIKCLARISGHALRDVFHLPKVTAELPAEQPARSRGRLPLVLSLVVLYAAGIAALFISDRSEIIPDHSRLAAFPNQIGPWLGQSTLLEPEVERGLGLDDYILADYKRSDGNAVNLYVAYYASQRKGESPHSPIVCIPGGGWQIINFERTSYLKNGVEMPLNRAVIERDSVREVVYYWFDERGRKIANEYWAKWYLLADAIVINRTDGALVRLITQIQSGETEGDADERLHAFMRDAVPTLSEYLPSEALKTVNNGPKGSQS